MLSAVCSFLGGNGACDGSSVVLSSRKLVSEVYFGNLACDGVFGANGSVTCTL